MQIWGKNSMHRAGVAAGFGLLAMLAASAMAPAQAMQDEVVEVSAVPAQAVREVDDPATGVRWLLVRDEVHPAGPGRWIRMSEPAAATNDPETAHINLEEKTPPTEEAETEDVRPRDAESLDATVEPPAPILIRGGDPIIVVQSTPVLTARLAAVALEPATAGKLIQARLKATRARVWVIALGPGSAELAPPGVAGQ
jgi:hypothetical protein